MTYKEAFDTRKTDISGIDRQFSHIKIVYTAPIDHVFSIRIESTDGLK